MTFDLNKNLTGQQFIIFTESLSSLIAFKEKISNHPYIHKLLESYHNLKKKKEEKNEKQS